MSYHKEAFRNSLQGYLGHVKAVMQSLNILDIDRYYYGSGSTDLIQFSDRNYHASIYDLWANLERIEERIREATTVRRLDEVSKLIGHNTYKVFKDRMV